MFELTASDRANRTALLLVQEYYSDKLATFVKNKKARLSYVRPNISQVIAEVCEDTGADPAYVAERFEDFLAAVLDPVLVNPGDVKKEKLKNETGPYTTNQDKAHEDSNADILDRGEVDGLGLDDALAPDARVDLNSETSDGETEVEYRSSKCFRCDAELDQKVAKVTPVCFNCTNELLKQGDASNLPGVDKAWGWGAAAEAPIPQEGPTENPNMPYVCAICGREGDRESLLSHINTDHGDVLQGQVTTPQDMGQNEPQQPALAAYDPAAEDDVVCPSCGTSGTNSQGQCLSCGRKLTLLDVRHPNSGQTVRDMVDDVGRGTYTGGVYDYENDPEFAPKIQDDDDYSMPERPSEQEQVNGWVAEQLRRRGIPEPLIDEILARRIDYHQVLNYIDQGASPQQAVAILSKVKEADVPPYQDSAEVEPLPDSPGDKFDDYVQRVAETAAARKFSMPSDEDLHSIASQIGADPDDIKNNIIVTAVYGDQVAVNGQLGADPTPPEGYEEISAQGLSGQQPTHDAVVPTDLIIQAVAKEMNMSDDLAYQQVKDKYGADLPTQYHASVSGQVHYYLPSQLAGNQMAQQQPQNPQVGPTAPPAPQAPVQGQPLAPTQ